MYYVDTHCHLYGETLEYINEIINEAKENNVMILINNSENLETAKEVVELSKKYNGIVYSAIGIHPEYASDVDKSQLEKLEQIIKNESVVAIGEIGLDYHYTKENREEQLNLFNAQLKLAEKYNLPVIIHSRDATKDTIDTLKKYKLKGSIHSFSGSYETAVEYIKLGYKLGINGVITFKNSNLKDVIKKIQLEDILLETDSPFLSPAPFRGQKNSPKNVAIIGEFLAKLFDVKISIIMEKTSINAMRVFDIIK